MKTLFASLILLLFTSASFAQNPVTNETKATQTTPIKDKDVVEYEMTTYYLGLIYRGPKWTAERTPEIEELQKAHLAHIGDMAKSGKLILAGPFMDNGNMRGLFLFKVNSLEEAKALSDSDPAVKAGRLIVEIHPWYAAKGITIDPSK